jgi:hypothetical protein
MGQNAKQSDKEETGEGKCKKTISGNTDERIHAQHVIRQKNQSFNFER